MMKSLCRKLTNADYESASETHAEVRVLKNRRQTANTPVIFRVDEVLHVMQSQFAVFHAFHRN